MVPLARGEMYALKLGRYPGANQATRYCSWRGYPACSYFLRAYPAVPLFFFALTLLCPYFSAHSRCCLPCCVLIFLYAYPAVPVFFYALTLLCSYFLVLLTLLCPYFSSYLLLS